MGGVKALLTFEEVQSSRKKEDLQKGSMVSGYVLFNKKGKGVALTLSKKKLESTDFASFKQQLPTQLDEIFSIASDLGIKPQQSIELGKVHKLRFIK